VLVTIGLDTLTANHQHPQPAHHSQATSSPATGGDVSSPATGSGASSSDGSANGHGSSTGATSGHGSSEPGGISGGRTVGGDGAALPAFTRGNSPAPGQIQWGGLISPAAARRIACCAGIQRILLDPAGAVLDVGREHRTATPAQFAALTARDGGCAFPGCTRPPPWCIAHHITHWADGGPTDLDNLALLCGHHHTVIHHHGWTITLAADRLPEFTPPPWIDPDQQPMRNTRPRYRQTIIVPDR
jgi:hypothetical protein